MVRRGGGHQLVLGLAAAGGGVTQSHPPGVKAESQQAAVRQVAQVAQTEMALPCRPAPPSAEQRGEALEKDNARGDAGWHFDADGAVVGRWCGMSTIDERATAAAVASRGGESLAEARRRGGNRSEILRGGESGERSTGCVLAKAFTANAGRWPSLTGVRA